MAQVTHEMLAGNCKRVDQPPADRIDLYAVRESLGLRGPEAWTLFVRLLCAQSRAIPVAAQVDMALRTIDALKTSASKSDDRAIKLAPEFVPIDAGGNHRFDNRPIDTPPDSPI